MKSQSIDWHNGSESPLYSDQIKPLIEGKVINVASVPEEECILSYVVVGNSALLSLHTRLERAADAGHDVGDPA